jgi:biopolymer transport protein ExbD
MQMGSSKTAATINVTPMIDILLVLLITFMLLPYKSKGLPSEIPPPAPADSQPSPADALDLTLRIHKDHSVDINTQPVLLLDVESRLKTLFASRPGGVLFIDGAPELEYADVASLIDIARGAGVYRIGLITQYELPDRERP